MDHEEYLRRIKSYIKTPTKDMEKMLEDFCSLCTYVSGQYDRDDSFLGLNKHLEEIEKDRKEGHRLFYMALPPSVFTIVSQHLKRCCYPTKGLARVIVGIPNYLSFFLFLFFLATYSPYLFNYNRSRNHSVKILLAQESFRSLWSLIGRRTSFSVLTTISARRW